ncbi:MULTISPECIES: XRE family transcriptional regulator [unclassified Mycolicibacterium]|uniref:XRE family transcriptional regulator n=1 Tax=unclassified Mycolicibacterium TaxID=2636767 RepID=UPI002ED90AB1
MTLAPEARDTRDPHRENVPPRGRSRTPLPPRKPPFDDRPVEYWPTAAIRAALETDDMAVWQRIVAAVKRDPYGRTARQVEEVLETARPYGVSKALSEVLVRTREHLEASERADVARGIQGLLRRSGLAPQEFASRAGVSNDDFANYLEGTVSPPASLLLRMQRLSDRFAKLAAQRSGQ